MTDTEKRPRPVRVMVAVIAGANMLALAVIPVLIGFEAIDWTPTQIGLVQTLIGTATVVIGGIIAAFQGSPTNPLTRVQSALHISPTEFRVTPTSDPRDSGMTPLVPTADDWVDD